MKKPTWKPIKVRLGQIKAWEHNPRLSTKAQAKRLIASENEFGQSQAFNLNPLEDGLYPLLDGHQRLSAWLTIYGDDYEMDGRVCSRTLNEDERKKYVIVHHVGATGSWDWDKVSGYDSQDLQGWGMDNKKLDEWNNDANNLKEMLRAEEPSKWEDGEDYEDLNNPDGIEVIAGYRLSSIWYDLPRKNEVYPHMLDLPPRVGVKKGKYAGIIHSRYSRTNATETERIVKTYMRPGDLFFEMCCGWMTFSATAKYYGFSGRGGDIWETSIEYCKRQIKAMPGDGVVDVVYADCMDTKEEDNKYDFVHSNPPFFSLENYSDSDNDLAATGDYNSWLFAMGKMGAEAERILKPGGLANFVINDYRKEGIIVPMHADFIKAILDGSGLVLHDVVIAEVMSQALRFRKKDYERRRTVKCHEYIITFKKVGE